MKKTYYLPSTETIPHIAMKCVMEGSINVTKPIEGPGEGPDPDPDALMM